MLFLPLVPDYRGEKMQEGRAKNVSEKGSFQRNGGEKCFVFPEGQRRLIIKVKKKECIGLNSFQK